jgi:hypothetical protein
MTISVYALIVKETAPQIFKRILGVMTALGLDTTSWRDGDPTKATAESEAEMLALREDMSVEAIKAGFLETAEGDWLDVVALDMYGVTRVQATFAAPTVTLQNASPGGLFEFDPGDLIVQASANDKTYKNSDPFTLTSGASAIVSLIADESGSDSNLSANEIDGIVAPPMPGVTIASSTAALATDKEGEPSLKARCRASHGPLPPTGPAAAYDSVARNPDLTGVTDVTRTRTIDDDVNLNVTVYVAGATGPVAASSVTAVQDAIETWATPLCVKPTVQNGAAVTLNLDVDIEGPVPAGTEALVESAFVAYLSAVSISDGTSILANSSIVALVHATAPAATRVTVNLPIDTVLPIGSFPVAGVVNVRLV